MEQRFFMGGSELLRYVIKLYEGAQARGPVGWSLVHIFSLSVPCLAPTLSTEDEDIDKLSYLSQNKPALFAVPILKQDIVLYFVELFSLKMRLND